MFVLLSGSGIHVLFRSLVCTAVIVGGCSARAALKRLHVFGHNQLPHIRLLMMLTCCLPVQSGMILTIDVLTNVTLTQCLT